MTPDRVLSPAAWFCAGFGVCFGLLIVLVVVVDIALARARQSTVSRRCITAAARRPAVAAALSGVLCLLVGMLLGHLFFGQAIAP